MFENHKKNFFCKTFVKRSKNSDTWKTSKIMFLAGKSLLDFSVWFLNPACAVSMNYANVYSQWGPIKYRSTLLPSLKAKSRGWEAEAASRIFWVSTVVVAGSSRRIESRGLERCRMVVDYAAAKAGLYGLATTSFPARDTGEKKAKKVGNLGKALCVSQYTVWKKRPEQRP